MPMRARWPPENWCGKRRISVGSRPDAIEHAGRRTPSAARRRDEAVHDRRLADDVDDAHARIERRVRILEDHLHRRAAARARSRRARRVDRRALPAALALAAAAGCRDRDAAERRLAAARFADQADHLAVRDREVDVVDRVHDLLAHVARPAGCAMLPGEVERLDEALRDAAQLEQRRAVRQRRHHRCAIGGQLQRASARRAADASSAACGDGVAWRSGGIAADRGARRSARGTRSRAAGRAATASCRGSGAAARRARCATAPSRAGRACRDAPDASSTSTRVPCSTMRPAYITQTRSARPAITDRSCVIQISAVPVSRAELLHLVQDLALDRDVERGGRLVGDDQVGLVQQRDRDRDALAHAAGELVRIRAAGARRATAMPTLHQRLARARERCGVADASRCAWIASIICVSMRSTGFSVIIGSWKIIAMRLPRRRAHALRPTASSARAPRRRMLPATMRPGGSIRPMIE